MVHVMQSVNCDGCIHISFHLEILLASDEIVCHTALPKSFSSVINFHVCICLLDCCKFRAIWTQCIIHSFISFHFFLFVSDRGGLVM